jgi:serine/threonine-protein kinase
MSTPCPVCRTPATESSRFCSSCGASIHSGSPSVASVAVALAGGATQFAPGTTLAGRYRIIGLLGRGGMGEVYRADDLKLDQPVALKFLPQALSGNAAALAAFHSEVRLARQISHPNVCRVYDIGEIDGQHFLSMEFIDGEDLGGLLRRIGRLPADKAAEFAREICAGLAAAHDKGVLHRDLKPSNIMIDGRGDARIADFGLAGLAGRFTDSDNFAGTPAYMAPEQMDGVDLTVRSDLYSLGLIMYEMVTGRRPFEAESLVELIRLHQEEPPEPPSQRVRDLDPGFERAILRCLEKAPERRFGSALALSASLPGGDPLAAALAAGQTPSPEMVAAAGGESGLKPRTANLLLAIFATGVLLSLWAGSSIFTYQMAPEPKRPEVLEEKARELLARIDLPQASGLSEAGFLEDDPLLRWMRARDATSARWDRLRSGEAPVLLYWYRQMHPRDVPGQLGALGRISRNDPPFEQAGMSSVLLDSQGRLKQISVIPPRTDSLAAVPPPDWSTWFAAAGLDTARFSPTEPERNPSFYVEDRRAWRGTLAGAPAESILVEGSTYRGRVARFAVIAPWDPRDRFNDRLSGGQRTAQSILSFLILLIVVGGGVLVTRRNLRLERADRAGAGRVALAVGASLMVAWLLVASHTSDLQSEINVFWNGMSIACLNGLLAWLVYVGVEPYVRRVKPHLLIGWTRLLAGGWRDPIVGRDVLIGAAAGVTMHVLQTVGWLVPGWIGEAPGIPLQIDPDTLLGGPEMLAALLTSLTNVVTTPLVVLIIYVIGRLVLKKDRLAIGAVVLLFGAAAVAGQSSVLGFVTGLLFTAILFTVLFRRGFLAAAAALLAEGLVSNYPFAMDPSTWYFPTTLLLLGLLALLGIGAWRAARGRVAGGALTTR